MPSSVGFGSNLGSWPGTRGDVTALDRYNRRHFSLGVQETRLLPERAFETSWNPEATQHEPVSCGPYTKLPLSDPLSLQASYVDRAKDLIFS